MGDNIKINLGEMDVKVRLDEQYFMAIYVSNTAARHLRQQLKNTEQSTVTNGTSC
jgi:hypothetical protein